MLRSGTDHFSGFGNYLWVRPGWVSDNTGSLPDLWRNLRHRDEDLAQLVSARIVQFAAAHGASILVFEHLGSLKPE